MSITNAATARQTLGSILGATATTFNSLIAVVDVGNTYVSKLQLSADDSYKRQKMESTIDNAMFKEQLIRSKTMEETESTLKAHEFMSKSEQHKLAYEESYKRFSALFTETK